ncbi:DUF3429 domain-containing protein [Vibrio sp. 404]|uniref:DUF3429 domain-containing protein n=1 Tax=Vibrio marinisediminis TaxID=2758441 RepID=A0A7W2FRV5_9VIBR|nr:DUF3429 domain-containing protein [Vibrio marinisediminis]MBA5763085.1 DUF3429 domain-containing protein [Vibrio marinisediminis]
MIIKLSYLGLLPFLVLPLGLLTPNLVTPTHLVQIYTMYSVCIAAFMAGTLWGREVEKPSAKPYMLLVTNGITLCVFAFALIAEVRMVGALIGLTLAHLMNFVCERNKSNIRYYKVRKALTIGAVSGHCLLLTLIIGSPAFG